MLGLNLVIFESKLDVCYVWTCYKLCLQSAWIGLWIAPCFRSRRAVSDGGPLLSVAYDLTCFMRVLKLCLENAWMRLPIVPSIRSRWAVSDGGLLLSVAYDLTCFIEFVANPTPPLPQKSKSEVFFGGGCSFQFSHSSIAPVGQFPASWERCYF